MADLAGLGAALARQEGEVPNLRLDCAKEVIWADEPGEKTDWAVIFIHGFSATKHEIRPLPDLIAKELGANIFYARLTGHGQDSDAMGRANLADWQVDTAEAFEIGHQLGRKLMVIACSTGCTMAALHLADGGKADAFVQVSPNYGLQFWPAQRLLEWEGSKVLHPLTVGREMILKPISEEHAAYWTLKYPIAAVALTTDAVQLVQKAPLSRVTTPTFFAVNPADRVISAPEAKATAARWGGPVTYHKVKAGPKDDAMGHVMAGDVFSPNQTAPLARRILDWVVDI